MSGQPNAPLLPPARAARLLEDVIFTRVAELIDLPRLYDLEEMLALQIENLDPALAGVSGEPAGEDARANNVDLDHGRVIAKAMIDRALLRVARTSRKWTRWAQARPGDGDDDACEICGSPCDPQKQNANA